MHSPSLQDITAPEGVCYGCGASNPYGLHIKSRWDEDRIHVIAEYQPEPHYTGWPDLVYGGLIAMLVDCHSNWTAMAYHYQAEHREPAACRVSIASPATWASNLSSPPPWASR